MRTIGPNEASLRIVDASAGAGRAQSLKAGAVISVRVLELVDSEAQLYRVAIGSRTLVASSSTPLALGSILRARVESSGATLLLRLLAPSPEAARAEAAGSEAARLPRASAAALISAAGLPADTASFSALAALLREGISPDPRALARVRRAALGEKPDATELAARMEAKGIAADGEALEGLIEACAGALPGGGHGDARGDAGRGDAGGGDHGNGEAATPELDLGRDFEREIPEPELGRMLAALLRGLAVRAEGDGGSETLALFNHARGPEGSWVIVPFRFGLDAIDFAGSFRIQLPYARGGAGRLEAVFTASSGAGLEEWGAYLRFGGGRASTLHIDAPKGRLGAFEGLFERLADELAALSCSVRVGSGTDALGASRGEAGLDLDA